MPPRNVVVPMLFFLASCGSGDSPTRPDPTGAPTITSLDPLAPGQIGVLRGRNLGVVSRITVDGKEALVTQATDAEVRFTVPALRACETDGRGVEVLVNGAVRVSGKVAAPGLVMLQPGESRVLTPAELGCVSFSANPAAYVLSLHNFSWERVTESFFHLRSYTVAADSSAGPLPSFHTAPVPVAGQREQHLMPAERAWGTANLHPANTPAVPFDAHYATAHEGDTLVFVDWTRTQSVTATVRSQVPVYQAAVVAIAGAQVVALDLRTPGAAELLSNSSLRARLRRAAEIADRYTLPAVRAVMDPDAAFPAGAGGRVFTIVHELPAGIVGGITTADLLGTTYSPWVSEIGIVDLGAGFIREQNVRAEQIASTMVHEHGHLADVLAGRRRGVANSAGWASEAFAVSVEERAARMAVGQEHQVTSAQTQADGVPTGGLRMPDGTSERYSPWGPFGTGLSASSTGAYVRGTRLLLFAMETLGETGFAPSTTSLYQRLLANSAAPNSLSAADLDRIWGIDAVARAAGLSAEELMDRASLAELTDDLVEPQAAAARGLPQFRTWNSALQSRSELQQRTFPTHWLPLDAARAGEVSVPGGGHHYWYLVTEPGRGLAVSATQVRMHSHHQVRVTRLW